MFKKSNSGFAQIFLVLILIAGILCGLYLVQHPQIFKPKAFFKNKSTVQEIYSLTAKLADYSFNPSSLSKEELTQVAQQRYEKLLLLASTDPESFLQTATLANQKDKLPEEVQQFIEEEEDVVGTLQTNHVDDFTNGKAIPTTQIVDDSNNQIYNLNLIDNSQKLPESSKVEANGTVIGNKLVVKNDKLKLQSTIVDNPAQNFPPIKNLKVAVILYKFIDPNPTTFEADDINAFMFGGAHNSVSDLYRKGSFGKVNIEGDVFGPYQMNFRSGLGYTDDDGTILDTRCIDGFESLVFQAAEREGVKIDDYDVAIYMPVQPTGCGVKGSEYTVSDKDARNHISRSVITAHTFLQNASIVQNHKFFMNSISHELGHSLLLSHANAYSCFDGQEGYSLITNCRTAEYFDETDPMGVAGVLDFNAPHKMQLGWLTDDMIKTVTTNGVYNVTPLEDNRGTLTDQGYTTTKVLKIPISIYRSADNFQAKQSEQGYYLISYRRPLGYDSAIPSKFLSGASIHIDLGGIDLGQKYAYGIPNFPHSQFINAGWTLKDGRVISDERFPSLVDGHFFYDSINKIKITQQKNDRGSAAILVEFNNDRRPNF